MPVSILIRVVLPAPFGPMTEKMRPAGISSDTERTACTPPKFFDRPSMARIVGGHRTRPPRVLRAEVPAQRGGR